MRSAVLLLAASSLVIVTTEFIVVGQLPALARDLDLSIAAAGRLVTAFALAAALLGPLLTMAAGRLDPRRVLVATLSVFGLGSLVAGLFPDYGVLMAVRVLQGALLPLFISVGNAAVASLAGPARSGRALAQVSIGVVVALVLAVPLGVALAEQIGWNGSFLLLAALTGLAIPALALAFPHVPVNGAHSIATQAGILRSPSVLLHLLLSGLFFTALFTGYSYLAAFLERVAGFDAEASALALLGFGTAGLVGNWAAGRLADRDATSATAQAAAVVVLAAGVVAPAAREPLLLLPLLGVWGAAHSAAFLLCQVRVMRAGDRAPAFASSLNISLANLGVALGALVGGELGERIGLESVGPGTAALAALSVVLAVVVLRFERTSRQRRIACAGLR